MSDVYERRVGIRRLTRRGRQRDRADLIDAVGRPAPTTACLAASMHLYLAPDGDVRACCRNWEALGNVATARLSDIWAGLRRTELVNRLAVDDFSFGCQQCDAEVAVEGRTDSYRANFDRFAPVSEGQAWPMRIEFNISNACNLQCVQCNGFLSSSIRTHREHLPPLPKVYGDAFFEDLRNFIPHLREAQFAGGEPFLAPENFRIWDMIEELAPGLPCTVVTNATQWTPRIERLLETHRMGFAFSIDGATKTTYEAIRIGADFDDVMRNLDRYTEYARRSGMSASINHCLMAQNLDEFHLMLRLAEERGLVVDVSVVRSPIHSSIASLPADQIRRSVDHLERFDSEMRDLPLNGATWQRELRRVRRWAESPDEFRELVWWDEVADTASPQRELIERRKARVLDFPCMGAGATDEHAVRRELEASGPVLSLVAAGADPIVVDCDDDLAAQLGVDPERLVGRSPMELLPLLTARFGELVNYVELERNDDRADVHITFPAAEVHCTMVPLRSATGWADRVQMFVRLSPT